MSLVTSTPTAEGKLSAPNRDSRWKGHPRWSSVPAKSSEPGRPPLEDLLRGLRHTEQLERFFKGVSDLPASQKKAGQRNGQGQAGPQPANQGIAAIDHLGRAAELLAVTPQPRAEQVAPFNQDLPSGFERPYFRDCNHARSFLSSEMVPANG